LLLSLLEIGVVLAVYASNRPKLAEQLISLQAERIAQVIREAPEDFQGKLSQLERPSGAQAWTFTVHDSRHRLLFSMPADESLPADRWPPAGAFDWTRRESLDGSETMYGGRHLPAAESEVWITIAVRGGGLSLFAPVFLREALDHVVLPVIPLTLLLLVINVIIVRRMLAPLAEAAAQVDGLSPASMNVRLDVPGTPHEVRALVQAVNRALDRMQHSMGVLESFTADAAHELRTPLSVLLLRVESLEDGPVKERLREDLSAMRRLADQLLDLAQAEVLEVRPESKVNLSDVARDVAARLHPVACTQDCDIQLVDRGGSSVPGHPEALARVLNNLIDNAIGHSPRGGTIDVVVGPGARLEVRDRGPGIAPEAAPSLFKRFWRGSAQSKARGGAGLGLAIVRSVLARHGASVTASNAQGGGASFVIEWPAAGVGGSDAPNPGVPR